eukprot:CAMPEP_0181306190 /NCGR_PEP_ID=MMETSP1101-20121128/10157_1 /TAXON_ID=46948 /ORGANISM="Rhodomonas abbreviata, Strain Caron Lab Isolate" /LENGTH=240 /DNA_ID=CAMNT_0023412209 /DNA_START=171 /DNA_END=893 /DNA_ORIENTATION=+
MGCCQRTFRLAAECLNSMLLLCGIALASFGVFLLYQWEHTPASSKHAPPNFYYMIVVLGGSTAFSNLVGYVGACSGSRCLMTTSVLMVGVLLLLELTLAGVLLVNPKLVEGQICPKGDKDCEKDMENIEAALHNPTELAGVTLIALFGLQALTMLATACLKCADRRGQEEAESLEEGLISREKWEKDREKLEERSRKQARTWTKLSDVTRNALTRQGKARPSPSWDSRPPPINPEAGGAA